MNEWLDKLEPLLQRPRMLLAQLNGGYCELEKLRAWTTKTIKLGLVVIVLCGVLSFVGNNFAIFVIGTIVACCIPVLRTRELAQQVSQRKMLILMALPELLAQLLLIVNAGENVLRALMKCADQRMDGENPLYDELKAALLAMKRGESLAISLEEMGRRCGVIEVKRFAATVLINTRRGGDSFVPALRELTSQMWDQRKALTRTLGEQASTRLTFPLTVIFLLIMVLVGAPAFFMM
ncbi:MAG: type II secretion system F family protein [Candidatus Cohnella colombiensis]|uniref:Type II secretion system F family protein n=1 Tax=Candidatus Cohnella colombiensis TaxID=3121368 RepID=A0AA95F1B0_9BACL|nr:MAG: type II secretion system F family protein [Cohnella sp.]